MIRIAIVEDSREDMNTLKKYIGQFSKEEGTEFSVTEYRDGLSLLDGYSGEHDVIFMDIEMPHLNGMEVARKLRLIDSVCAIIFVTNMPQFAIEGYEVSALDFMVKPVGYFNFKVKLKKALRYTGQHRGKAIFIDNGTEMMKLPVSEIQYVEKYKNYVIYHTLSGTYRERTTIASVEERLKDCGFLRSSSGCLVNCKEVTGYTTTSVLVGGEELPIARGRRKEFIGDLTKYFG